MDLLAGIYVAAAIVGILGIVGIAFVVVQWRDRNAARVPGLVLRTPVGVTRDQAGRLRLTVINNGGQAVRFLAIVHAATDFFYFVGSLGEKSRDDFAAQPVAAATSEMKSVITVAMAALDADQHWWNALGKPARINEPINEWLAAECKRYGHGCPSLTAPT